jgi:hypothetical protein
MARRQDLPERATTAARKPHPHPDWLRLLRAEYGDAYIDHEMWAQVIERDTCADEAEILDAVEWMAERAWERPKTARDLVVAIRSMRKEARRAAGVPAAREKEECDRCGGGGWQFDWPLLNIEEAKAVAERRGVHPGKEIYERQMTHYRRTIPCHCGAGAIAVHTDAAMKRARDAEPKDYDSWRWLAFSRFGEMERLIREWLRADAVKAPNARMPRPLQATIFRDADPADMGW